MSQLQNYTKYYNAIKIHITTVGYPIPPAFSYRCSLKGFFLFFDIYPILLYNNFFYETLTTLKVSELFSPTSLLCTFLYFAWCLLHSGLVVYFYRHHTFCACAVTASTPSYDAYMSRENYLYRGCFPLVNRTLLFISLCQRYTVTYLSCQQYKVI